jgi:hypothetical protein
MNIRKLLDEPHERAIAILSFLGFVAIGILVNFISNRIEEKYKARRLK